MRFTGLTSSVWRQRVITWLVYSASGLAAMLTAAPDSPVSQLYIAAGVALGLVLGWGLRMLPPIALGGVTVVVCGHWMMGSAHGAHLVAVQAVVSGAGAALQAWLAHRFILGRAQNIADLPLDRAWAIGRFLVLAGPVASVTNATLSVSTMALLGMVPASFAPTAFLQWWAADTMGVIVAAPLILTWVGHPRDLWRARRSVVGVPMALAMLLLGTAIHYAQRWDAERSAVIFEQHAQALQNEAKLRLHGYLHALEALHGLYQSSDTVTRQEFQRASQFWLANLEGIQALGWSARIEQADLAGFEQQQGKSRPGFQVFDRSDMTPERRPPQGKELVVITYIEPLGGNERALGTNILSLSHPRQTYEKALQSGRSTASESFVLTQSVHQERGVVVYRPVLSEKGAVRGTLFLTLRLDEVLRVLLKNKPSYLGACLVEGEGPRTSANQVPAGDCAQAFEHAPTRHRREISMAFAGSVWRLQLWADKPVPLVGRGVAAWAVTLAGVALTAALGAMLLILSAHTRQVEEAAAEAERQRVAAEEASRAKSEFLSRMSHELRTPLNAVLGFAQVMEMDTQTPLSGHQLQRLGQIQQAGWHLLDMIDDVLDISRIETGTLRLNTEHVGVAAAIEQACKQVQQQAANLGITVTWPHDIPASWAVSADPIRLRQILQTLLDNGITYNHSPGSVTVSIARQQKADGSASMVISVRDTGQGMTDEQLSQLFQPFNRLGREKGTPDGAGVGLAISRHLATLMGGSLDASSRIGEGSTFTLTLPAHALPPEVDPAVQDDSRTSPLDVGSQNKYVLYVEDNLANSEVVREALAPHPWIRTRIAPTIEQGLNALHNRLMGPRPDLILLDVHLPDASGQEFLRLVKANPDTASIPVVMISADAMPEQIDKALAAGAADYMTKPVQLQQLVQKLETLLRPST